jgi:putative Mn2+ efflux pump MntP
MSFLAILALAAALAMDAFAVSVSAAVTLPHITWKHYARLSCAFGGFQFIMPVLGWLLGMSVHSYIEQWDHWIAFALLSLVGLNMLRESLSSAEEERPFGDPTCGMTLFVLAVATSIDALAVGLSFAMIDVSVWKPAVIIGAVCAAITAVGVRLGRWIGDSGLLGHWASAAGALVLIGIGFKILYEHGVF